EVLILFLFLKHSKTEISEKRALHLEDQRDPGAVAPVAARCRRGVCVHKSYSRFGCGFRGGPVGTSRDCVAWFCAKHEILPRMHSNCRLPCNREAIFSAF